MNTRILRLMLAFCFVFAFSVFSPVKASGDNAGILIKETQAPHSEKEEKITRVAAGNKLLSSEISDDLALVSGGSADTQVSYIIETVNGIYTAKGNDSEFRDNSLAGLINKIESDSIVIEFSSIYSEENIVIEKSVTLSGTLNLKNAFLVFCGEFVTLDDFCFLGENASIQIRGGTTVANSGAISVSESSAVILDFHSGARFLANGIDILAKSQRAAIFCELGSVEILGGNISNKYGAAVENHGTLALSENAALSGVRYEVVTDKPVSLVGCRGALSSELRVKYNSFFEKGSYTVIFRNVSEHALPYISLFDASGEKISLDYFECSKYNDEKNVLSVYLPYTLRLYSGGEIYSSVSFIKNEIIAAQEGVKKEGYSFVGWYRDTALSEPYSFGRTEEDDFNLYAAHKLEPPMFSISSLEFLYDGKKRTLGFDYIYHTLMDNGQFSFVWYKNGSAIQNSASGIQICNVSDSGVYFCKLTFSYRGDFVTVTSPEVNVTVHKMTVFKPDDTSKIYTGEPISADVGESQYFKYDKTSFFDVGEYFIELTLRDKENYKWSDSEDDKTTVKLEILRAENVFLEGPTVEDIYESELPRVKYSLKFGEGYAEFSEDGVIWTITAPKLAGEYYLRVCADESKNYTAVISDSVKFTVLEDICVGIKIDKLPEKTVYRAFDVIDLFGAELSATYGSGRSESIPLDKIKAEYKNGICFTVTDTSLILVFEGNSVPISVTVLPTEYDLSELVFEDKEVVYDGSRHTLSVISNVVGRDGIALGYKIVGGGVDVGIYEVTLVFSSTSINYELPKSITKTLYITPLEVTAEYSNTEFVYDGTPKLPCVSILGALGAPVSFTVSGMGTDVGNYIATVTLDDVNHILVNPEVEFLISKADFNLSGVRWSADRFTYNGESHSVLLSGLPNGLTVVGYANSSFIDAGCYIAEATVIYDDKNYNSPGRFTHEWKIERADYDLLGFTFVNSEYVFDGEYHYPLFYGTLPTGFDGISLSYSFSEGVLHATEEGVSVTVIFETQSKNYNTPSSMTVYVTVKPMPIEIEWENLSFVYDGTTHVPNARSSLCEINITGGGVNAGIYTATAYSESSDYEIVNCEISFEIAKATNSWTTAFTVDSVFFGDPQSAFAEALSGDVEYLYYKDRELNEAVSLPLCVGEYYAVATVAETENYLSLVSEPLVFSVFEIIPIGLTVEICEPLFAMHSLLDFSVSAYLLNNNGSKTYISPEKLTVEYQNGDSLRFGDSFVTVAYGEFSSTSEITVSKKQIKIPILAPVTYSGVSLFPEALISPLFTTDFSGAKNAGEYNVSLTLFDSENYEFCDGISTVTFKILKAPITLRVKKNGTDYEIVDGKLFEGDTLHEEYYEKDGKILLRISNPNYELTVIPREEKSASLYILIFFLFGIAVVFASVGLYIRFFRFEKRAVSDVDIKPLRKEKKEIKLYENLAESHSEPPLETLLAVDEAHANNLISDFVAKSLIADEYESVQTSGVRKYILNLDTISENFSAGESVDINDFKKKGLLPEDARSVKILARGVIDKPIHIRANAFSLAAVKMIALTGGSAKRVRTSRIKNN